MLAPLVGFGKVTEVSYPAIDNLVESSLESESEDLRLKWIPYKEITNIKLTTTDAIYYATHKHMQYGK